MTKNVLILRTCAKDGTSYGGFRWPLTIGAEVVAPDWNPEPVCGGGLHGLLWGMGNVNLMDVSGVSVGVVFEADADAVVAIGDKVKVSRGVVRFVGTLPEAAAWINERQPSPTQTGYLGTLTGGYRSTLTGGDGSTLTGGYRSTLTGGDGSTLTGGDGSTLTGGYRSTLTGGYGAYLCWVFWRDGKRQLRQGIVGDGLLLAGVAYRLNYKDEIEAAERGE